MVTGAGSAVPLAVSSSRLTEWLPMAVGWERMVTLTFA
jgi:hypothetical protein